MEPQDKAPTPGAVDREALERAIRFIEYRPRSGGETLDRLRRWGYSAAASNEVVVYLRTCGLIDDCEFARVYVGEMLRKGFGYHRVRAELLKKRLDRELMDEVLEDYPMEEELTRACEIAQELASRSVGGQSPGARRKIVGYLTRRGYSSKVASEAWGLAFDVDTNLGPE